MPNPKKRVPGAGAAEAEAAAAAGTCDGCCSSSPAMTSAAGSAGGGEAAAGGSRRSLNAASAVAGAVSGMLVGCMLQPFDVVGTRMKGDSALGTSRSALATARGIVAAQGLQGLWMGLGPSLIRMGLGIGLQMVLVDYAVGALTRQLDNGKHHLSSLNAALAGGIPRALATVLLNPITLIKTRMEYSGRDAVRYKGTWHALLTIARTEGLSGLLRGVIPTILTNAPASGLYYMFYTRLREQLAAPGRPQLLINLSSGLMAAAAATITTQPFDVIRTRVQLSVQSAAAAGHRVGSMDVLKIALQQHGPSSLVVGTLPRVLKRTAQTALVWTLYEELLPRLTAAYVGAAALIAQRETQRPLR